MTITLILKEHRERAGFSQRGLAKAAGIAQCRVCRYDNGREFPTIETMIRLAKPLGIEWHELVKVEGEEHV